jgi:arylesterase / paraoxonase
MLIRMKEIVLHQPTGILFLACSDPERRALWLPSMNNLNSSGASGGYIATYDPQTFRVTRLSLHGFDITRGLSTNGMDVVPSSHNQNELYIYVVNHRPPLQLDPNDRVQHGADSVIEIFKTTLGSNTLEYLTTVEDPSIIITPNGVSGSADGKSFYITNERSVKTGIVSR